MNKNRIILFHSAFWLLLLINNTVPPFMANRYFSFSAEVSGLWLFFKYLLVNFSYLIMLIICFYSSYSLIARTLFVKKRYWLGLGLVLLLIVGLIVMRLVIEYGLLKPILGFDNYLGRRPSVYFYISNVVLYYPSCFLYGMMYFLAENWYLAQQRQQNLQKENMITELAFLRSQINPHFLFNTINDIYALTYQKAEQAPEALLKLSELLRYMLRDSKQEMMPILQEIAYLQNMIDLQRISAKGNAYIHFEVTGEHLDQRVAALLFVSFVENAFKHGILADPERPVRIRLETNLQQIDFYCYNQKIKGRKDKTGGIGLSNVRRRLELLYPERHTLDIKEDLFSFEVHLTIMF